MKRWQGMPRRTALALTASRSAAVSRLTVPVILNDVSRAQDGEARLKAIDVIEGKFRVVVATERGSACRIISAWRTNTVEERLMGMVRYEWARPTLHG